jgi:hypothetical protein
MFIRGSSSGVESKRSDESFYRGIVVKNNDPLKLNRVKVYIPELTNQPFEEWFDKYEEINIKVPGVNNPSDSWNDIQIFNEICNTIPWAEPCYPLIGESGNSRYFKDEELAVITDGNYSEGFEINNTEVPAISSGSFSPSFLYENKETTLGDAFGQPLQNYSIKCNTYSFGYKSMKFSNKTKGIIGIPQVGSKVWVFHYQGDLNFPVYFGVMQDYRSLTILNNTDNDELISNTYPNDFEN